jgi:hypothetical protein
MDRDRKKLHSPLSTPDKRVTYPDLVDLQSAGPHRDPYKPGSYTDEGLRGNAYNANVLDTVLDMGGFADIPDFPHFDTVFAQFQITGYRHCLH